MQKILITSAIPYINGVKHLGNLAGSLLPADVHARFRRQAGDDVLFVCGTDEHGTPAELAALAAGLEVRAYCDAQHEVQADVYRRFGLSFDHFGRSSSPANHDLTQHLYRCLDEAGLIEERTVPQIWSPHDGRYLPDRYVLGTCPRCGHGSARGDQCDACGSLLDPVDLVEPRSAISGERGLEVRESRHLYLRQSALRERLLDWVGSRSGWPDWVTSLSRGLLGEDLRDRCITRDLSWGVPVPRPGFEGKVFYVWFDAPIAYVAGTREWAGADPGTRDWRDWWGEGDGARYLQFLGKDNVPFHAVSFPATLLGSGEPIRTVDVIKGFHWLTFGNGGKFSTSEGRGIFADKALEELPADAWRWWLTANAPETSDVDFLLSRFAADVNKDLGDVFGNLANRVSRFVGGAYGGTVPDGGGPGPDEEGVAREASELVGRIRADHEALEFRRAAAGTRAFWALSNAYLHRSSPWTAIRTDPDRAAVACRTAIRLVELSARLAWSVVPDLAGRVLAACGVGEAVPAWPRDAEAFLLARGGARISLDAPPFAKVSPEHLERLEARFGGEARSSTGSGAGPLEAASPLP